MKKSILMVLILMVSLTFVSAEQGLRNQNQQQDNELIGQRMMAQVGEHNGPQGQQMNLERIQNKFRLRTGNISADCDCNLTQEQDQNRTRFYTGLSNGRNAEIKIMPDTASETALARLRLKLCENCTIELKETGKGNESRLTYELKTQKRARFLGLFRTRMQVQAQVDAENGEVIQVKRPWWSFLASEEDETQE